MLYIRYISPQEAENMRKNILPNDNVNVRKPLQLHTAQKDLIEVVIGKKLNNKNSFIEPEFKSAFNSIQDSRFKKSERLLKKSFNYFMRDAKGTV